MANWRERLYRFMSGRYGMDALYKFLQVLFWISFVVNLFLRSTVMSVITWVILIVMLLRVFSRRHEARRRENELYLQLSKPLRSWGSLQMRKIRDRNHRFRRCPNCRTILRLPVKKGKHTVTCPMCHQDVKVRIRF